MNDIRIISRYPKEETIRKLWQLFADGNPFDVKLQVVHGEYYLGPVPPAVMTNQVSIDPFSLQFRLKEDKATGHTILEITPQSRAFALTIVVLILFLLWIFLLVATLENKGLMPPMYYVGGVGISIFVMLAQKFGMRKEKLVLNKLKAEFELP